MNNSAVDFVQPYLNQSPNLGLFRSVGTHTLVGTALEGNLGFALRGVGDITIDNVIVKEIPGYHAVQSTSTARPVLQGSAGDYYLDFDGVDDRLLVNTSGFTGTAYIADELGSAAYGIAIPSGTYTIGTNTSALTNSFAFGGSNSVLAVRVFED